MNSHTLHVCTHAFYEKFLRRLLLRWDNYLKDGCQLTQTIFIFYVCHRTSWASNQRTQSEMFRLSWCTMQFSEIVALGLPSIWKHLTLLSALSVRFWAICNSGVTASIVFTTTCSISAHNLYVSCPTKMKGVKYDEYKSLSARSQVNCVSFNNQEKRSF